MIYDRVIKRIIDLLLSGLALLVLSPVYSARVELLQIHGLKGGIK